MDNIICMKWGTKFSPDYVNRLAANVKRNLTRPYRFVCFTDDTTGLRSDIETFPLPEMDLPSHLPERGWRKLTVFKKPLENLEGPALFLDLDVVIAESLDPFFELPGSFRIIEDWSYKGKHIGNSSVFRFETGAHPGILQNFIDHFEEIRGRLRNEQAYLSEWMYNKGILEYWPAEWCRSFKRSFMRAFPLGYFVEPQPIPGTKIIVFHGNPNPDVVSTGWHSSNFLRAVTKTPWLAELRKE